MHLLKAICFLTYFFSVKAGPLIRPKLFRRSCTKSVPVLEEEQLYVNDPAGYRSTFWNFGSSDGPRAGGTPGHDPGPVRWSLTISSSPPATYPSGSIQNSGVYGGTYRREEIVNLTKYPWNTIGRVFFERFKGDKGGWCTGTLVGRDLILTASHCFPWGYSDGRWMRFIPGFGNNTEPYGNSYISRCRGVKNMFNVTGIDYVVCQLCQPLGDRIGWMGTRWWKDEAPYLNRPWSSSGYPIDSFHGRAQMFIPNISLFEIEYHADLGVELESATFASAGWSGGPMWGYIDGKPTIVGVCSGGERDCSERVGGCQSSDTDDYHDVSAGGKLMSDLILHGMSNW